MIKAFLTNWKGIEGVTYAVSAGKARYANMLSGRDAGYDVQLTEIEVKRLPEYDNYVTLMGETPNTNTCWDKGFLKERE